MEEKKVKGITVDTVKKLVFVFLTVTQTLTKSLFLLGLLQSLPPLSTFEPRHLAKPMALLNRLGQSYMIYPWHIIMTVYWGVGGRGHNVIHSA